VLNSLPQLRGGKSCLKSRKNSLPAPARRRGPQPSRCRACRGAAALSACGSSSSSTSSTRALRPDLEHLVSASSAGVSTAGPRVLDGRRYLRASGGVGFGEHGQRLLHLDSVRDEGVAPKLGFSNMKYYGSHARSPPRPSCRCSTPSPRRSQGPDCHRRPTSRRSTGVEDDCSRRYEDHRVR